MGLTGGWAATGLSPRDQELAANWPTQNVGLRAADFPGVDADVESLEARAMVEEIVTETLGKAPVRGRGNSPRALFVFRRGGDLPIRKVRLEFNDGEKDHAVEVLGLGQQYAINGMHKTGVAYEWRDDRDLRTSSVDTLTPVTAEQIAAMMAQVEAAIVKKGWKVTKTFKPKYGLGANGSPALVANQLDPIIPDDPALSKELAMQALNVLENNHEQFPTREDFLSLVSSFKHVLGREADAAFPEFVKWATKGDDGFAYSEEEIRFIWDSLTTVRVSTDHLFGLARRRGFRGDAQIDFAGMEIDPGTAAPARVNGQVNVAEVERENIEAIENQLLYIEPSMTWVVKGSGTELSHAALNASAIGTVIAQAGSTGLKTAANQLINRGRVKTIKGITYLAGRGEVVDWEEEGHKGLYYNRWHSVPHALPDSVSDADVKPWLDHVKLVITRDDEREHFLDYLAFLVQYRGRKVRYAPIIIGAQGTGKDLMIRPLMNFFAHNAVEVQPEQLQAKFNAFLERELVVVQEMVRYDKKEAYDSIKIMIAGSGKDTLTVERKYKNPYTVPNNVNMIFFTNHLDAVGLEDDDRRFFVLQSDMTRQEPSYYERLADDFYTAQSGWRRVIRWLMQRDVSEFKPDATPPNTVGKDEMKRAQQPQYQIVIQTQLESGFHKDRTVLTSGELFDTVTGDHNYPIDQGSRRFVSSISKVVEVLKKAGWRQHPAPIRVKGYPGTPVRLWVRDAAMLNKDPKELRAKMEAEIEAQKPKF